MSTTSREIPCPSPSPSPAKLLDIDLTVVSGKHLKNVNWRHGDLVAYAVAWIDPDHKLPTAVDSSGGTKPVWNERLSPALPLTNLDRSFLTIDVLHLSDPSSPLSKTLVGSARLSLSDAGDGHDSPRLLSLELRRPSGRPHGKINVKIAVKERFLPPASAPASYFPLPSQSRDFRSYSSYQYVDPSYPRPPNYYPGLYTHPSPFPPPPPPPQAVAVDYYNRPGYLCGPSAPFDSSPASSSLYTADYRKVKGPKVGFETGVAVGAVTGALSELALEEGIKYEEEKAAERAEKDMSVRERLPDYRGDY